MIKFFPEKIGWTKRDSTCFKYPSMSRAELFLFLGTKMWVTQLFGAKGVKGRKKCQKSKKWGYNAEMRVNKKWLFSKNILTEFWLFPYIVFITNMFVKVSERGCDMKFTEMIKLAKSPTDGDFVEHKSFTFLNATSSNILPHKENV